MIKTLSVPIDISLTFDADGINLYIGEDETPSTAYALDSLITDFLDNVCDLDGRVYEDISYELDDVITKFEECLTILKNAKRD